MMILCNNLTFSSSDKLLLKVHKTDTDVMLSLAAYNPSYVSPNTVIGAEDSLKIFPASYKTGSQEQLEKVGNGNGDEKKKKKKGKRGTASKATVEAIQTETTPEETPRGESADDSGDSRPQTSDIGEEAYVENGSDGSDIGDAADNENTPKEVAI